MDSQLLFGERFRVLECRSGWAFGQMGRDGYVGYVRTHHLGPDFCPTHRVNSLWTQIHQGPEARRIPIRTVPFGSLLEISGRSSSGAFTELAGGGYVPAGHVGPAEGPARDPVAEAERFLGVPYLWGGSSPAGIDCSGLVQMALVAAGDDCPRDSDMQEAGWGDWVADSDQPRRGDLVFWRGHVGIMVDARILLHATGHCMAVVREPLAEVAARIKTQENAPFRGLKRSPRR